jgi:hypothetical protein
MFKLFSRKKKVQQGALSSEHSNDIPALVLNRMYTSEYHFNVVGSPQPGQAYVSPLLQFQSWTNAEVQGAGTLVQSYFKPFEPQYANTQLQPVTSGTSGILTGAMASQPLVDTTSIGTVG